MIREALQWIVQQAETQILEIDGVPYSTGELIECRPPRPHAIQLRTLSGLVDYLNSDIDKIDQTNTFLRIATESTVTLEANLIAPFMERHNFISTVALNLDHKFGTWMDMERFMIYLQTSFVQTQAMRDLQTIVGNIADGAKITVKDDGVTQETTVKNGIILVGDAAIPNPVELAPFRTFIEIEQPASKFVLRLRKTAGIEAALFEADGGAWRNVAIARIAEYLRAKNLKPTVLA